MKPLERLRQTKATAVNRMTELNSLAARESRDLSDSEKKEFDQCKTQAETLDAQIKVVEEVLAQEPKEPSTKPGPTLIPPANEEALRAEGATRETARVNSIKERCASAKMTDAFTLEMVSSKLTIEEVTSKIFEKLATPTDPKAPNTNIPSGASVTNDKRDKLRIGLEAALEVRANSKAAPEILAAGREFAGLNLIDMARECLSASGVRHQGMSREKIARVALQGVHGEAEYFSGGMMTTSDFPNILANVANKSLRQAYLAAPRTFTGFAREVSATDFKPINRVQLSDVPTLSALGEHGEYHRSSVSDSKETYSLATFGEVIAITRKTIINDDLQALSRIPQGLGYAAANLESDTVWGVITANAALSDTVALFHATHANLNTTNAAAEAGMSIMRAAMRIQTGPKGTYLNLTPAFVMVPVALEATIIKLLTTSLFPAVFTNVVPEWIRSITPVVEPRLDANSTSTWYAAAAPGMIDTIEYCYLEGNQGAYIETRQGFDVDGVEIKARLDFAAAAIDFRGLAKNTA